MQSLLSLILSLCIAVGLTVAASDYESLFKEIDACKKPSEKLMCARCADDLQLGLTEQDCCTSEVGYNVCDFCVNDIEECLAIRDEFYSGIMQKREEKRKRFGRLFFNKKTGSDEMRKRFGTVFFGGRGRSFAGKAKREVKTSS
jgi:hypothetical protein